MAKLEEEIAQLLREYQAKTGKILTLASIESATGGRIGDKITNVPGSSDYYKGAIVAYSNEIKATIVGVKEKTLKTHGAVSSETAMKMAKGGRKLLKADICIADTGIAGPTGASPQKPVGLFYLGLSTKSTSFSHKHNFKGNREQNKQKATEAALNMVKEYLQKLLSKIDKIIEEKHVVTCFLEHDNKILILKRSSKVGTYQGKWAGVSGYAETNALKQAFTEIKEETGLDENEVELRAKGKTLRIIDNNLKRKWIIHPFLFQVKSLGKLKVDWEHDEMKWINPEEITAYNTVPGLNDALDRVISN